MSDTSTNLPPVGHPNYNEGQELPVEPFGDDHQSSHPQEDHACSNCGIVSTIGVPPDSMSMVWECPHCGAKSRTPGNPPHLLAQAQAAVIAAQAAAAALLAGEAPVVHVVADDAGESGDATV